MRAKELIERLYNRLLPIYGENEAMSGSRLLSEEIWGALYHQPERDIEVNEDDLLRVIHDIEHERPLQHIIGHAYFYDRKFRVSEAVLTPRQETEELVYKIIKDNSSDTSREKRVLDIGTGSGIIPITLSLEMPNIKATAIDISSEALEIARYNAELYGVDIDYLSMDILNETPSGRYDIIVSNPPYIEICEKELMRNNVLNYEPHIALFVEGNDPLLFYRRIAYISRELLNEGGALYFEINERFGSECCEMLKLMGYSGVTLLKDLNDKPRIVYGKNR